MANPCLITDDLGVFVTVGGTGAGTQAAPTGSIAGAMALAKTAGKSKVFVCGTSPFEQPVIVGTAQDGVAVYGGFTACPATGAWTSSASARTAVAPKAVGPALSVSGIANGVTFRNFSFNAIAAPVSTPGQSSIAASVVNSVKVNFVGCGFVAGAGAAGAQGATPTTALPPSIKGSDADSASNAGGAATAPLACPNGTSSIGAKGGTGAAVGGTATDGESGQPVLSTNDGRAAPNVTAICTNGGVGVSGGVGSDAPSPTTLVTLSGGALAATSGSQGAYGGTAQGGGGGGGGFATAISSNGNGGGSGGSGGCGGAGGGGGGGGGSSIGMLSLNSSVTVTSSSMTTAAAGAGGSGAGGQPGGVGNLHGNSVSNGCPGGNGGTGGKGGAGAGGSGGVSAAIVHNGTAPTLDQVTQAAITLGPAGVKGLGGKPGTNDGLPGTAESFYAVP